MDDITSRINEIFSSPEGMEKIKTIMNMFSAPQGQAQAPPPPESAAPPPPPPPFGGAPGGMPNSNASNAGLPDFDPAVLMKITQAMSLLKQDDPRIGLLTALRDNLSDPRRRRVDEAIQLMRLLNLMPMLMEQGLLSGFLNPGSPQGPGDARNPAP